MAPFSLRLHSATHFDIAYCRRLRARRLPSFTLRAFGQRSRLGVALRFAGLLSRSHCCRHLRLRHLEGARTSVGKRNVWKRVSFVSFVFRFVHSVCSPCIAQCLWRINSTMQLNFAQKLSLADVPKSYMTSWCLRAGSHTQSCDRIAPPQIATWISLASWFWPRTLDWICTSLPAPNSREPPS